MKNKVFGSLMLASLLGVNLDAVDITNDVFNLNNKTNSANDTFSINSTTTYSSLGKSFTQTYSNGILIFGNTTASTGTGNVRFGGTGFFNGGLLGYITANFQSSSLYLTGSLLAGNSATTGGGATLNFTTTNTATIQDFTLNFTKAGTQNSHFNLQANSINLLGKVDIQNATGGSIALNANTISGSINTINSSGNVTLSSQNPSSINISTLTLNGSTLMGGNSNFSITNFINSSGDLNITTSGDIAIENARFQGSGIGDGLLIGRTFFVKGKDINFGESSNLIFRNHSVFKVEGENFDFKGTIELASNLTVTDDSTLDLTNVSGTKKINKILMYVSSVYGSNLDIGTIEVFKSNSRSVFRSSIGKTSIGNLTLANGNSAADNTVLEFREGGESLNIGNLNIGSWGVVDASKVESVSIDNLTSSFATIRANKNLEIKTANFNNNETYLYTSAQGNITIQDMTLQNNAKLYIKEGESLEAKNLIMESGAVLVAQKDNANGNMTGTTTIDHINLNNSSIYANNLITKDITIQNNASIYLSDKGVYTNEGDLNISDGSALNITGDFINQGSLNLSLKPNNTQLIHTSGTFQFNLDVGEEQTKEITNIVNGQEVVEQVTLFLPKNKINIYASTQDFITGAKYTLIQADSGITFLKDNQVYTYSGLNSQDDTYGTLADTFKQNIFFYDKQNQPIAVNFESSFDVDGSKNILSFIIPVNGVYIDVTPYIQPGTWFFGLGEGNAIFGRLDGAGGLARNYTVKLEPQTGKDSSGEEKPAIYYLKDLTYHNSGNTQAILTIDATGSKLALGKDRETAGHTGNIIVGDALAKSNLKVKADSIYLGGNITLGDGALISGHLNLETTKTNGNEDNMDGFIGSNDNNQDALIRIRNHSSLTASGDIFNYQGKILATGNGTVSDEVTLNLSGITGAQTITLYDEENNPISTNYKIFIQYLTLRDAKKIGEGETSGGVSASDFLINTLEVQSGNNTYSEFLTDIGTSKINHLILNAGTSQADSSVLKFNTQSNALDIDSLTLQSFSNLEANKIQEVSISKEASINNASAYLNTLKLANDSNLTLSVNNSIGNTLVNIQEDLYAGENTKITINNTQSSLTLTSAKLNVHKNILLSQGSQLEVMGHQASITSESLQAQGSTITLSNQALSTIQTLTLTQSQLNIYDSTLNATNVILNNSNISTNSNSNITFSGDFMLNGSLKYYLSQSVQPIQVEGKTTIDLSNENNGVYVYNLANFQGAKVGETYTILNSNKDIEYLVNGAPTSQLAVQQRFGFFNSENEDSRIDSGSSFQYGNFIITKVLENNSIGFKIDVPSTPTNPYDVNRIEHYLFERGGEKWVDDVRSVGIEAIEYLQTLMLDKNNAIWTTQVLGEHDLNYILKVARTLKNAADQIGSPTRKSSQLDILNLATDVNKNNRLVKLSSTFQSEEESLARALEYLRKQKLTLASIDSQENKESSDYLTPTNLLIAQAIRDNYKNNVWATAIGAANFVQGGNATLYGINAGYDRSFKIKDTRVVLGGYMAYAYSTYYGDLIQNHANNLNIGLYTRAFIPNGEIDFSASQTIGFMNEYIQSKEIITSQLNQNYHYQSYITYLNFNYGYLFYLNEKSFILKPKIGLSYFYIGNSKINGKNSNLFYADILASANADNKNVLAIQAGLEARKYLSEQSYWYVIGILSQDLLVASEGDRTIRFIGQNTLAFQNGDKAVNLRAELTIGGEIEIARRTYLNLGLGSKLGILYKDIGVSGNVGVRYIF